MPIYPAGAHGTQTLEAQRERGSSSEGWRGGRESDECDDDSTGSDDSSTHLTPSKIGPDADVESSDDELPDDTSDGGEGDMSPRAPPARESAGPSVVTNV